MHRASDRAHAPPVTVIGPIPGADATLARAATGPAALTTTGWPATMNTAPSVGPTIVIEPIPVAAVQVDVTIA